MRRLLKRMPGLYGFLQRGYYRALFLAEDNFLGTRLHEALWRIRPGESPEASGSPHPHRTFLVERLGRLAPFKSVLEVGCGSGLNFVALERAYPHLRLYGVDLNARAIVSAKALLKRAGIPDAQVTVGRADDLSEFPSKSVDIVLTDATLMYVGPDKISRVVDELVRVAHKSVIMNEWHLFDATSERHSLWYFAHWVHDYRTLLGSRRGVKALRIERLPRGLWGSGGGWEAFGALIEADLDS